MQNCLQICLSICFELRKRANSLEGDKFLIENHRISPKGTGFAEGNKFSGGGQGSEAGGQEPVAGLCEAGSSARIGSADIRPVHPSVRP
jgi:hypothetical protein